MTTPKALTNSPIPTFSDRRGILAHGQATITAQAVLRSSNDQRRSLTLKCISGGPVYVGSSAVLTTDGYEVKSGESLTMAQCTEAVSITSSVSSDVRFIEELAS